MMGTPTVRCHNQSDAIVLVALGVEEVRDILEGDLDAEWVCGLQASVQCLVASGDIDVSQTWLVSGTVQVSAPVEAEVEASSEEEARQVFEDLVNDDLEDVVAWDGAQVEDICIDQAGLA